MASMCAFASPFLVSNRSLVVRKNTFLNQNSKKNVACEKRVYSSPHYELMNVATVSPIIRRSASYPPSLWPYERIQAINSRYTGEKYASRLETLKEEVRTKIYKENEKAENPLSTLNLVDDLQRLGIWYHFVDDISNVLDNVYNKYYKGREKWNTLDLNLKALGFRLLRHNGYHITQDIFEDFKDETSNFIGHSIEDTLGMLNLYEASYHSFEDENILDEARDFTRKYLQGSLGKINDEYLSSLTSRALDMPLHWRIARVETKWFIEAYEKRSGMNPTVLNLAKLDFNMVQAVHQEDLKHASRWWRTTKWDDKLSFARDRLVENYMWTIGNSYRPQFTLLRRILTKVFAIITTVDDIYDVHGTLDELEKFTDVISRWNIYSIEELPDYMKICFLGFYNSVNDMTYTTLTDTGFFILPYLQKAGEKYASRLETLKEEVRIKIYKENEKAENPLSTLNLVDDLQRLGIWYHFVDDISNVLDNVYNKYYKSPEKWNTLDLNLKALGFRLLRHNGYHITQDIFEDVKDETSNFKGHSIEDTLGMLNLYEASYHSFEDENILDEARDFTTKYLQGSLGKINDQYLSSLTSRALDMPLHWRIARVETKWFIEAYEKRSGMNPTLLDLAKLDFNMVQAVHQEDLKHVSRWWRTTKWDDKLSFARDRLVENYMWTIGNSYRPQFTLLRRILTKVFAIITTVDDIYDVHGTLDELEKFTDVISRWNIYSIEELPDYMKICFLGFYNSVNDMTYTTLTDTGFFILPYLQKALLLANLNKTPCQIIQSLSLTILMQHTLNKAC
ncbi:camphene synthase [Artemisia annua]|uniref:Camphene synthase n=1 Tax=Artemisia annua TaxID=35608 RepID=A0A2U1Q3B8_ARTAN|nr:camphene synthase [Artemisia annua]